MTKPHTRPRYGTVKLFVFELPPLVVTLTLTPPCTPDGTFTFTWVFFQEVYVVAATVPKYTAAPLWLLPKPLPDRVTLVPAPPEAGLSEPM